MERVLTEWLKELTESLYDEVAPSGTDVFLRMNGFKLEVEPDPAHAFLLGLLEQTICDFAHLDPWLRSSMVLI